MPLKLHRHPAGLAGRPVTVEDVQLAAEVLPWTTTVATEHVIHVHGERVTLRAATARLR